MSNLVYGTAEWFLDRIRTKGGFGDNSADGSTDDDILGYLNLEMSKVVGTLLRTKEEDYVVSELINISANKSRYRMPDRAMFNRLQDVMYRKDNVRYVLEPINRKHLADYDYLSSSDTPEHYYPESNYIVLVPDMSSAAGGQLELSYCFRPGQLVDHNECRQVSSISGNTVNFSSAIPSGWSVTDTFEIHSYKSGAEIKDWDLTAVSASGTSITFTNKIDGSIYGTNAVEADDWICLTEQAALPGIPEDMYNYLIISTVIRMATTLGDVTKVQIFTDELDRMTADLGILLESRIENRAQKFSNRNGHFWR